MNQYDKMDLKCLLTWISVQFYFQTYRGAGEPGRPRRQQLLLERVHLHALVLGDFVQVLVPVRERELGTVSAKRGEILHCAL